MWNFLKKLIGTRSTPSAHFNPLIVGVWAPVGGNPKEVMEYCKDGTVTMAMFGGLFPRPGAYRFIDRDVLQIDWLDKPSANAQAMLGALNAQLATQGHTFQARAHQQSVLKVDVTETDLRTLHIEKQRHGHFHRVA